MPIILVQSSLQIYQMHNKKYQENIISIIRKLERAEKLCGKEGEEDKRAYILYYLGYFYFKSKDFFTAKEKLEECIKLKSSLKSPASELLGYIWNYQIRPPFWRWWWSSPLNRYIKRIIFLVLVLTIFLLFLLHPFTPTLWCSFSDQVWCTSLQINWTLYVFFIVLLISILILPSIERIKVKDIELELQSPPTDFSLSPAKIEKTIVELELKKEQPKQTKE